MNKITSIQNYSFSSNNQTQHTVDLTERKFFMRTFPIAIRSLRASAIYFALSLFLLMGITATAHAQTVINFDEGGLTHGTTLVPTQYPEVTFSTNGNRVVVLGTASNYNTSPPNFICASGDCFADLTLTFTNPVNGLSFRALGSNTTGVIAKVDVFQNGVLSSTVDINGAGNNRTPITVDLSAFNNVTSIRIYLVPNSETGIKDNLGYDDFTFTVAPLNPDSDGDSIPNTCDVDSNPGATDFDNDGIVDSSSCDTEIGPPTNKDQCKNDGWMRFNTPAFKNQGDCIQFVNTGK